MSSRARSMPSLRSPIATQTDYLRFTQTQCRTHLRAKQLTHCLTRDPEHQRLAQQVVRKELGTMSHVRYSRGADGSLITDGEMRWRAGSTSSCRASVSAIFERSPLAIARRLPSRVHCTSFIRLYSPGTGASIGRQINQQQVPCSARKRNFIYRGRTERLQREI